MNSHKALLLAVPLVDRAAEISVPPSRGVSSRVDTIKQRGSLRIAVFDEYSWLKHTADGGAPVEGPARRLTEGYAKRLGVRIKIVPVTQGGETHA